jgi:mannose-6-phosphate isomerase-like protein (cupin superfamily)
MPAIVRVDPRTDFFRIHRDLRVSVGEHRPGPPERIDGFTAGLVTMAADAPHGGEVHPDGDEILVIIDGRVQVTGDVADLLAGHHRITTGPGEPHPLPVGADVIHTETGRHESTTVVRASARVPDAEPVDLEDLVLAYLTRAASLEVVA